MANDRAHIRTSAESLKDHINGRLLTKSEGRAWNNVLVQLLSHRPLETSLLVPAVAEPLLVWITSGAATIEERELNGEWLSSEVRARDFFLTRSPAPYEMRWTSTGPDPFQVMHVYLGLPLWDDAVAEIRPGGHLQLQEVSGKRDDRISGLLDLVRTELTSPHDPSEMYVQGLAHALAVHLVRTYSDVNVRDSRKRGALPAFKLRRVTDLMENGLDRDFSLEALAAVAGLSPFHFSRVFKQSTGFTPSAYFIRLRMAEARRLLRETDKAIIEIGLDVGYSSPSHFAQVFRKEVGVTPSEYRD